MPCALRWSVGGTAMIEMTIMALAMCIIAVTYGTIVVIGAIAYKNYRRMSDD